MESRLALAPRNPPTLVRTRAARLVPTVVSTAGLLAVLAVTFVMASLPISSLLLLAGAAGFCVMLGALSGPPDHLEIDPNDIASTDLRATYRAILDARTELAHVLARAPGFAKVGAAVREQCDAAITLCSRVAPVTNRLEHFLATHDLSQIENEAASLQERAETATDEVAARGFHDAATACTRQLATCRQLVEIRDRMHARLELVRTSLVAFTATIVRLQTVEEEQLALADNAVSDHVAEATEELAELESALRTTGQAA